MQEMVDAAAVTRLNCHGSVVRVIVRNSTVWAEHLSPRPPGGWCAAAAPTPLHPALHRTAHRCRRAHTLEGRHAGSHTRSHSRMRDHALCPHELLPVRGLGFRAHEGELKWSRRVGRRAVQRDGARRWDAAAGGVNGG